MKIDHTCPVCFSPNDEVNSTDGSNVDPVPGDVSFCAYCGMLQRFYEKSDGSLALRPTTGPEAEEFLRAHPNIPVAVVASSDSLSAALDAVRNRLRENRES